MVVSQHQSEHHSEVSSPVSPKSPAFLKSARSNKSLAASHHDGEYDHIHGALESAAFKTSPRKASVSPRRVGFHAELINRLSDSAELQMPGVIDSDVVVVDPPPKSRPVPADQSISHASLPSQSPEPIQIQPPTPIVTVVRNDLANTVAKMLSDKQERERKERESAQRKADEERERLQQQPSQKDDAPGMSSSSRLTVTGGKSSGSEQANAADNVGSLTNSTHAGDKSRDKSPIEMKMQTASKIVSMLKMNSAQKKIERPGPVTIDVKPAQRKDSLKSLPPLLKKSKDSSVIGEKTDAKSFVANASQNLNMGKVEARVDTGRKADLSEEREMDGSLGDTMSKKRFSLLDKNREALKKMAEQRKLKAAQSEESKQRRRNSLIAMRRKMGLENVTSKFGNIPKGDGFQKSQKLDALNSSMARNANRTVDSERSEEQILPSQSTDE